MLSHPTSEQFLPPAHAYDKAADGSKAGSMCVSRHAPEGRGAVRRLRVNYRYYNPVDGRWMRRDSIEVMDGWNSYLFIKNIPYLYYDSLGESCMGDCLDDPDYTDVLISSFLAYMIGGPIPKPWVPAVFDALGYSDLARQARVGIKMGKKTITTIPSTVSVALKAGGRSLLRSLGRRVVPLAVAMTTLDAIILGYCGWHCIWNDCYNKEKDNMWKRITISEIFHNERLY